MSFLSGTSMIPAPAKGFYGWRMVVFAALALALTGPGQTFGVSVFVDPMIEELGITRTQMSTAYLIGTLAGAVALPWIGQAIDRFGVRRVMAVVAALFGLFLMGMAFVTGFVTLSAGFIGIRMMGQGALGLVATTGVALWFSRKRGLAMGIVTAAGGFGMTMVPLVFEFAISGWGWRTAWIAEALTVWIIVVPLAIFGIRNRPADVGQHVDGDAEAPPGDGDSWGVSRREALSTSFFWVVSAAVVATALLTTALVFHQIDLLGERGFTVTEAAANFIPQTLATVAVTLGVGALADRVSARLVLILSMLLLIGGLLLVTVASPGLLGIGFGALLGASGGAARVVEATELPRYFGTLHIGSIRGVVTALAVSGTALGPVLFALGHDLTGDYTAVLLFSTVLPAAVVIGALFVRLPAHMEPDADGEAHLVREER
jgi:MFS family permease